MYKAEVGKMLIVDDRNMNRQIWSELFSDEYDIARAEDETQAMDILKRRSDEFAIVLLELAVSGTSGLKLLEELGKFNLLAKVPVVVVTAEDNGEIESRALELGAADILREPFVCSVVRRRVKNVTSAHSYRASLEKLTMDLSTRLENSNEAVIETLVSVIEHRSLESGQHIVRIKKFTKLLLKQVAIDYPKYNLEEETIDIIAGASTLHDVGKIVIPDSILNKPGKLTPEQFEIMKTHAAEGSKLVMKFRGIHDKTYVDFAYNIARYHHERWDGKGYPEHLSGVDIPICAQVVAIADVYDALTTHRVYKPAYSHDEAILMIMNGECGAFSEEMKSCLKAVALQFNLLAEQYADGMITPALELQALPQRDQNHVLLEQVARIDHYKYMTVLKMLGAIVVEHDYDIDEFKVVYPRGKLYDKYEMDGNIEAGADKFIEKYVHPKDQERMRKNLNQKEIAMAKGKFINDTTRYRIIAPDTGIYWNYDVSYTRIYTQNLMHHKAMLVFRRV